jgi:adenine phosphoribosyltransferase
MSELIESRIKGALRTVPDYPKLGVTFQDITPVLRDAALFKAAVDAMSAPFARQGVTHVLAIEARGFILGGAIAAVLGAGFIPARKAGKLPWETVRKVFTLEYGDDTLEAHRDEFTDDSQIIVVDDVLATGGTAAAAADLVAQLNGKLVGYTFLLEILVLKGRAALGETPVHVVTAV